MQHDDSEHDHEHDHDDILELAAEAESDGPQDSEWDPEEQSFEEWLGILPLPQRKDGVAVLRALYEEARETGIDPESRDIVALRWTSDMQAFWGLCRHTACRRARCCNGDAEDCLDRYSYVISREAANGVEAFSSGVADGLSFAEIAEQHLADLAALAEWIARVERAALPPRRSTAA